MGMDTLVLPQELVALGQRRSCRVPGQWCLGVFALCRGLRHHSTAPAAPCPWESLGHWDQLHAWA